MPARLDALTDMSYGTYGSEKKDMGIAHAVDNRSMTLGNRPSHAHMNLLMPVDTLISSSLCC